MGHKALIWGYVLSLGSNQLFDTSTISSGWCGKLVTLVEKQNTDFFGKTFYSGSPHWK